MKTFSTPRKKRTLSCMLRFFGHTLIVVLLTLIVPITSASAATNLTLQERAQERAATRLGLKAVERRVNSSSRASVPRSILRTRTIIQRPSIRQIRQNAIKNRVNPSSSSSSRRSRSSSKPSNPSVIPEEMQLGDGLDTLRQQILELVNIQRSREGLDPLIYNRSLQTAAQEHADEMQQNGYFSHESLNGRNFSQRIGATGWPGSCPFEDCVPSKTTGENLALGFSEAEKGMDAWMNSEHHKANILNPAFKEIGIGIAGVYWVQDFGGVVFNK